jgi:chitinase
MLIAIVCLLTAAALFALSADARASSSSDLAIIGYMPEYRHALNYNYEEAFAMGLTHVIMFSLEVSLHQPFIPSQLDRLPPPEVMKRARAAADRYGGKLLICFGGNSRTGGFAAMVKTKEKRSIFLHTLNSMMLEKGFDGVDYNWEYPASEAEWKGLVHLLRESKESLLPTKGGPILTMAFYPDPQQYGVIKEHKLYKHVDYIMSMSYDMRGRHSEFNFATYTLDTWAKNGLPYDQLALGVPFYGRDINTGEANTYSEILPHVLRRGKEESSKNSLMEGEEDKVNELGSMYFNGANMISEKVKLAGGKGSHIMIWELGQDSELTHPFSLLRAACQAKNETVALKAAGAARQDTPAAEFVSVEL